MDKFRRVGVYASALSTPTIFCIWLMIVSGSIGFSMDPVQPALNAFSLLPVMAYEVNAMMCELGTLLSRGVFER